MLSLSIPSLLINILLISVTIIYLYILFTSKILYIYAFIILAFSFGMIDLFFSSALGKAAISGYSFLFFIKSTSEVYFSQRRFFLPGIYFFSFLLSAILMAYIIDTKSSYVYGVLYMSENLIRHYIILIAVLNLYITSFHLTRIKKIFMVAIMTQILMAFVKLYVRGIREKGLIGTISSGEGSVTMIFVMFVVSIFIPYFLYHYRFRFLIMSGLGIFFGIINAKRAILFFVPFLSICLLGIYLIFERSKSILFYKKFPIYFSLIILFGLLSMYLIVRFNPSLNPEREIGGSFNVDYLVSYISSYITVEDNKVVRLYDYRRYDALFYLLDKEWNESIIHFFFGQGAGYLVPSQRFNEVKSDPVTAETGIRYGARTGFLFYFLQIGIIGACLVMLLQIKFFIDLFNIFRKELYSTEVKILSLAAMGFIITFFIDFITYSHSVLDSFPLSFFYSSLLGLIYRAYYTVDDNNESVR